MYIVIAIAMLAVAAFIILSAKDLIKYLIKRKRLQAKGEAALEEQESYRKLIKKNLILLPSSIAIFVVLYFVLTVLFP